MFQAGDRIEVVIPGKNYPHITDFSCFHNCSYAEETYIGGWGALKRGDTGCVIDCGIYHGAMVYLISLDRIGGTYIVGEKGISQLNDPLDLQIDTQDFEKLLNGDM